MDRPSILYLAPLDPPHQPYPKTVINKLVSSAKMEIHYSCSDTIKQTPTNHARTHAHKEHCAEKPAQKLETVGTKVPEHYWGHSLVSLGG